jgi:hypothetical protein
MVGGSKDRWFRIKKFVSTNQPMVQSSSREVNSCSASQKIPRLVWNPKVHYRVHRSPPIPLTSVTFHNNFLFRWGVIPSLNPIYRKPPLIGCPRLLFQCFRSYPLYLEAVSSICNPRTRHVMMTGSHIPHEEALFCTGRCWYVSRTSSQRHWRCCCTHGTGCMPQSELLSLLSLTWEMLTKFWSERLKLGNHSEDLEVDAQIILQWECGKVWTSCDLFSGGLLWARVM